MVSLMRSGNTLSSISREESQILPGPTQASAGTEWRLLQAFRSHHERLECKNQYQPLDQSQQKLEFVELRNATGFFDTGLRQILTKGDLDTLVENKLEHQKDKTQSHLEALCSSLDRLVNVDLLYHGSAMPPGQNETRLYPNLSTLLQLLDETSWHFELVAGQGNKLFQFAPEVHAIEAREVVHRFNDFFSHTLQIPTRVERLEQPATDPWQRRNELRDRAVIGLKSLFSHVPQEQSEECKGHQILVKLPDWDCIGPQATEPKPVLDLFLSTCLDSAKWHATHCDVQSSIPLDTYDTCTFCGDLSDAHISGNIFRLTASNANLFIPCMDMDIAGQQLFRRDHQPTLTLHSLLHNGSFVETQSLTPLMPLTRTQRFNKRQKRSLTARLALCLSLYLNSEYTLKACDSSHVFFIGENGRCERNMTYVFSSVNENYKETRYDQSNPTYIFLARLLLEIEYGVSLEKMELQDLKKWVNDRLSMSPDEEQEAKLSGDMTDIRSMQARQIYLHAVRDLLNFKQTYRRGSRQLKGKFSDIGTIASEIIFTNIAEKIRSTIEPIHLETSGLAGLKENLYQQKQVAAETARSAGHRPMDFGVHSASQPREHQGSTGTVIQLSGENDDVSYVKEYLSKCQNSEGTNRIQYPVASFHDGKTVVRGRWLENLKYISGRIKKLQLCRPLESFTPVRIAILDTGYAAMLPFFSQTKRAKRICGWRDFVGNLGIDNPTINGTIRGDDYGHGSLMARLAMESAPLADIYIARVAKNTDGLSSGTEGIAKAIRWAGLDEKVDIISMSFGFPHDDVDIAKAIEDVERRRSVIFLASAGNNAAYQAETFPARHRSVISIRATDCNGTFSASNPPMVDRCVNSVLGTFGGDLPENILKEMSGHFKASLCRPGSSIATAVAAGIAASTIAYAEVLSSVLNVPAKENPTRILKSTEGMLRMLEKMAPEQTGHHRFVNPIWFWSETTGPQMAWAKMCDPVSQLMYQRQ